MTHHSSRVHGEGTSHKDHQSRILDELSSLKLWNRKRDKVIDWMSEKKNIEM